VLQDESEYTFVHAQPVSPLTVFIIF